MAVLVKHSLVDRYAASIKFPEGSARELISYWGPGLTRVFKREEIPTHALLQSSHKVLHEFICISARLAMCREAKDRIECLEPNTHQFFEVKIQRKSSRKPIFCSSGDVLNDTYFLINPGVRLDAVCLEKSEVVIKKYEHIPDLVSSLPGRENKIFLKKSVISNHHVWKGQYQLGGGLFFSNFLYSEILKLNWKGLKFIEIPEI